MIVYTNHAPLLLNQDLDAIWEFSWKYAIVVNPNKSRVLVFGKSVRNISLPPVEINGVVVPVVNR